MISVLLLAFDRSGQRAAAPGDAVRTLAALVPATVDGLVRDLCLAGPTGEGNLPDVADHAGCTFVAAADVPEAVLRGLPRLRCDHVMVARAGLVVDRPLLDELTGLLPRLPGHDGTFILKAVRDDLLGRMFPSTAPVAAVLASRRSLEAAKPPTFEALTRSGRSRQTLKTRGWLKG